MKEKERKEMSRIKKLLLNTIEKSRFLLRMSPSSGKIEMTQIPLEALIIHPQEIPDIIKNPEVVDRQVLISVYQATKGRIELEGITLQGG